MSSAATPSAVKPSSTARPTPSWKNSACAPDEQSRQFIRERLSGRSIQSTLEEQAEDLDEERELLDTDVEDVEAVEDLETLVVDDPSEDLHDED